MAANQNRHTEEYRRETADYALSCDKSVSQAAGDLGLKQATSNRWVLKRRKELDGGCFLVGRYPRGQRTQEAG